VHLHSTNLKSSFHPLKDNQNNIEVERESSMKVAVQQEDLQLLAKTLQEQLLVEVSSAEVFEVKCAVNKDGLMILTQHESDVMVDAQIIFAVIEEVLQSVTPHRERQVQCFLRVFGEQLPYAKCFLALKQTGGWGDGGAGEQGAEEKYFSPISPSALTYSPSFDETEEEEAFDPFADAPNFATSKSAFQIKPIFLGAVLVGIVVLGGGAYLLTRPCVMSECKEIQNAQQLKTKSPQIMRHAKSEKELVAVQQQLTATSAALNVIPSWVAPLPGIGRNKSKFVWTLRKN
jgi:hypothetical protein